MAYRLVDGKSKEFDGLSYAETQLALYDVIVLDWNAWSHDFEPVLYARSALEFVREQLPAARAVALDEVDAFWRAHPEAFNHFARYHHAQKDTKTALVGWVVNEAGHAPEIPKAHWWWWPLEVKA